MYFLPYITFRIRKLFIIKFYEIYSMPICVEVDKEIQLLQIIFSWQFNIKYLFEFIAFLLRKYIYHFQFGKVEYT
jgi:hypothetical protein